MLGSFSRFSLIFSGFFGAVEEISYAALVLSDEGLEDGVVRNGNWRRRG